MVREGESGNRSSVMTEITDIPDVLSARLRERPSNHSEDLFLEGPWNHIEGWCAPSTAAVIEI